MWWRRGSGRGMGIRSNERRRLFRVVWVCVEGGGRVVEFFFFFNFSVRLNMVVTGLIRRLPKQKSHDFHSHVELPPTVHRPLFSPILPHGTINTDCCPTSPS